MPELQHALSFWNGLGQRKALIKWGSKPHLSNSCADKVQSTWYCCSGKKKKDMEEEEEKKEKDEQEEEEQEQELEQEEELIAGAGWDENFQN